MPSHRESYGLVYIEAMAQGTIPIATDAPIQREMLDGGNAGILTHPTPSQIADDIAPWLNDHCAMRELALRSWRRCRKEFLPDVVAAKMFDVFTEAKNAA